MQGQQRGRDSYDFIFNPMFGHFSSMEDRQRFVKGKPYQPITECALVIKCRDMASGREQAIFYSNKGSVRIAKHAVCDKIQQAAVSRSPDVKRNAAVR
jgi:hypothetical protein